MTFSLTTKKVLVYLCVTCYYVVVVVVFMFMLFGKARVYLSKAP